MNGFDSETERYVLGSMVNDSNLLSDGIAELQTDDFSVKEYMALFNLISVAYQAGEEITVTSFYIKHSTKLKELGISWTRVTDVFTNAVDFKTACKKLKANTKARQLLALTDRIKKGLEAEQDIGEITADIEKTVLDCDVGEKRLYMSPKNLAIRCSDELAARIDQTKKKAIYTSFYHLNTISGGFEAGDLVILSGGTGTGKSAFAMNLARDIGITQKKPCLYVNSEMSEAQMALRWTALLAETSHRKLRTGEIKTEAYGQIMCKLDLCYSGLVHTLTIPDLRLDRVASELRRFKAHEGIEVAFIDYIGRCDFLDAKNKDEWQILTGAARKLKTLAQELEIVIIMLAQLNTSGRLAQASYMSHEADLWLNLDKPDPEELEDPWNMVLQIKKARNAECGEIRLYFCGDLLTFTDNKEVAIKLDRKADLERKAG